MKKFFSIFIFAIITIVIIALVLAGLAWVAVNDGPIIGCLFLILWIMTDLISGKFKKK